MIINNDPEPPPEKMGYDDCTFQLIVAPFIIATTFLLVIDRFDLIFNFNVI